MKFPRKAKLSGAAEFGAVFKKPSASRDAFFRILSRPNDLPYNRLGLAVSRRVCAKASGRNRLKRIIRESFRKQQATWVETAARDFVVLPSAAAVAISNAELFESLNTHWRRHRRLNNETIRSKAEMPGGIRQPKGN